MKDIVKTENGWLLNGHAGNVEVNELCFIGDLKHGLALLPGTLNEVLERIARIHKRIDKSEHDLVVPVSLGEDVDEMEATYMMETCLLPRRVLMRLKS